MIETPLNIYFPNLENTGKALASQVVLRAGFNTKAGLEVSDKASPEGEPNLYKLSELQGVPALTSLVIKYGGDVFTLEECIISINQEKNIITTALQGRNGTIKEYISDGDYLINIWAGISNLSTLEQNQGINISYPKEEIARLIRLLEVPDTLVVQSDFLEIFGIKSAVVKTYELQQETHSNRQSIQIQMLSDEPYEIMVSHRG